MKDGDQSEGDTSGGAIALLDLGSKLTGLAAAMSLVLSIVYDWANLRAVGLQLSEIPTSITDHVRSTILWFPLLLIAIFGYVVIEFSTKRIEKGLTEDEIVGGSKDPRKTRRFRDLPHRLIPWITGLAAVSFLMFGEQLLDEWAPWGVVILWFVFASWLHSPPLIQRRRSPVAKLLITFVPAVFLWFGVQGFVTGRQLLRQDKPTYEVSFVDASKPKRDVIVARAFDRVLIAIDAESKETIVVDWNSISELRRLIQAEQWRGILGWILPDKIVDRGESEDKTETSSDESP